MRNTDMNVCMCVYALKLSPSTIMIMMLTMTEAKVIRSLVFSLSPACTNTHKLTQIDEYFMYVSRMCEWERDSGKSKQIKYLSTDLEKFHRRLMMAKYDDKFLS